MPSKTHRDHLFTLVNIAASGYVEPRIWETASKSRHRMNALKLYQDGVDWTAPVIDLDDLKKAVDTYGMPDMWEKGLLGFVWLLSWCIRRDPRKAGRLVIYWQDAETNIHALRKHVGLPYDESLNDLPPERQPKRYGSSFFAGGGA